MSEDIPTIGRVVRYVSKNGDGIISPAIILRTRAATDPEVAASWEKGGREGRPHKPLGSPPEGFQIELGSDTHVDLLVHGLGGDYREYNIPYLAVSNLVDPEDVAEQRERAAGTWHWPVGAPERI